MKRIHYLICLLIIASVVSALVGASMAAGNIFIPLVAIPLGVLIILICRKRVTERIEDERVRKIRAKAALRTIETLLILGAITASILYAYWGIGMSPQITGIKSIDDNGTISETITIYNSGSEQIPANIIRSITIPDTNAMNESEADAYCQFWREGLRTNQDSGFAGLIIGFCLLVLILSYAGFYYYYNKKY